MVCIIIHINYVLGVATAESAVKSNRQLTFHGSPIRWPFRRHRSTPYVQDSLLRTEYMLHTERGTHLNRADQVPPPGLSYSESQCTKGQKHGPCKREEMQIARHVFHCFGLDA